MHSYLPSLLDLKTYTFLAYASSRYILEIFFIKKCHRLCYLQLFQTQKLRNKCVGERLEIVICQGQKMIRLINLVDEIVRRLILPQAAICRKTYIRRLLKIQYRASFSTTLVYKELICKHEG